MDVTARAGNLAAARALPRTLLPRAICIGRWAAVLMLLVGGGCSGGQSADEALLRGDEAFASGQLEQAVSCYSQALAIDNRSVAAYVNRADAYLALERPTDAIADCTRAIELDASAVAAYYNRGVARLELEQFDQAIADFTRAIDLDPTDADAWYQRGQARLGQAGPEAAQEDFATAVRLGGGARELFPQVNDSVRAQIDHPHRETTLAPWPDPDSDPHADGNDGNEVATTSLSQP